MVPRRLIDLMMSHPSNDIYWMTTADLNEITEYTPEREELYIAKCNFDRRRINSLLDAEDRRDQRRVDLLNQELSNSEGCIQELRLKTFYQARRKIANGWLPIDPFSGRNDQSSSIPKLDREKVIEDAHPGWENLVKTRSFHDWLNLQVESIQKLASSNEPNDAITLLNKFKVDVAKVEKTDRSPLAVDVESIHPGWLATTKSGNFQRWLKEQPVSIANLAKSKAPRDLVRVLDLYKLDMERGR